MNKARIMVVEDEGIVALDIQSKLEAMGYEVPALVSSGAEAVRQAREIRPDLILMDIQLEGEMDGVEAAGRIGEALQIPIVYLTAYSDEHTLGRAKAAQPFGYLLKPFEERELYTTVEVALYKHQAELEKARLEEQLRQAQKMEAIGQLTAGVSYNFNHMLQGIIGNLDLALMSAADDLRPFLEDAAFDAERAARLVQQLMLFYHREHSRRQALDLGSLIEEAAAMCRTHFERTVGLALEVKLDLPRVEGNPEELKRCLVNLITNAREALAPRDPGAESSPGIHITAAAADLREPGEGRTPEAGPGLYVRLEVADQGAGMDRETQEHIFEPFFTTKKGGRNAGLGLALVYGIVKDHGGWIECESEPGAGTTFSVYLPALERESPPLSKGNAGRPEAASEAPPGGALRGSETILVIADIDRARNTLGLMLERSGYKVLLGRDGRDGLELFGHEHRNIDLVVLDLFTPDISSQEVLAGILKQDPGARVLIITGHAINGSTWTGARAVLTKPFNTRRLLQALRRVLDGDPAPGD